MEGLHKIHTEDGTTKEIFPEKRSPFEGGLPGMGLTEEATPPLETADVAQKGMSLNFIPLPVTHQVSCWSAEIPPLEERAHLDLKVIDWGNRPIAGRVRQARVNWGKLTRDPTILEMVDGCQIKFMSNPQQLLTIQAPRLSLSEQHLVHIEIRKLVQKGAVVAASRNETRFLGHIFLRQKKDGSQRPIFNLKKLNQWVEYVHFKMEGLHIVKSSST